MMMKRTIGFLLTMAFLLPGVLVSHAETSFRKYSSSFFGTFDTIVTLIGYTSEEADFKAVLLETQEMMTRYHEVFDAYNAYEGVNNLYYVNHNAAQGPVPAEPELIEALLWARETQKELGERINIAMGAVLSLWHEYRAEGSSLPPMEALLAAREHGNIDDVVIDAENGTVYFADPLLSIDLGAVAKGYAVEKVAADLLEKKMPSYILNAGGNVKCGNKPLDGRDNWGVSIQDPGDGKGEVPNTYLDVLYLTDQSVVTSGDYQRYYEVDGKRYHHIIDLDTLMPANYLRAVTVVTRDSGFADALSTTLFNMSYEDGLALVESLEDTEVYWVLPDGEIHSTEGLQPWLMSQRNQ